MLPEKSNLRQIQQHNLLSRQIRILGGISKCSEYFFHTQAQLPHKVRIVSSHGEGKIKLCSNKLVLKQTYTSIWQYYLFTLFLSASFHLFSCLGRMQRMLFLRETIRYKELKHKNYVQVKYPKRKSDIMESYTSLMNNKLF